MSLKLPPLPTIRPQGITCTDWSHCGDPSQKRRCAHIVREDSGNYATSQRDKFVMLPDGKLWRGACELPMRMMCEEWLKVRPEDRMDAVVGLSLDATANDASLLAQKWGKDELLEKEATQVAALQENATAWPLRSSVDDPEEREAIQAEGMSEAERQQRVDAARERERVAKEWRFDDALRKATAGRREFAR